MFFFFFFHLPACVFLCFLVNRLSKDTGLSCDLWLGSPCGGWVGFIMIIKCEWGLQSEAVRGADTSGSVCFLSWREQLDVWLFILEVHLQPSGLSDLSPKPCYLCQLFIFLIINILSDNFSLCSFFFPPDNRWSYFAKTNGLSNAPQYTHTPRATCRQGVTCCFETLKLPTSQVTAHNIL